MAETARPRCRLSLVQPTDIAQLRRLDRYFYPNGMLADDVYTEGEIAVNPSAETGGEAMVLARLLFLV